MNDEQIAAVHVAQLINYLCTTGIGMAPETTKRVFERFYRADESRHEPGFGLGLSLVKSIVNSYGGDIRCTSLPAQGSTFTVELPRQI